MTTDDQHVPAARTGTYPVRRGTRVRPLVDGEPAFRRICEAVAAARSRVWVTVAFVERDAELPDGQGTLFDVLDRAVARGLDVRVLFWREPGLSPFPGWHHFRGTDEERTWLRARDSCFLARWDHLPRYCHHQKSWVVDAGESGEVAFVGGINLDRASIAPPGHRSPLASTHDVYVELAGPAVTDVHHNFVQRWNEASERARPDGAWPDAARAGDLPFPGHLSPARGDASVQITRTVRAGRYAATVAAPGAARFGVAGGEKSVLEQYVAAIDAATRAIYLEQQFFAAPEILARLEAALQRGVAVVVVVPRAPIDEVRAVRRDPRGRALAEQLAGLGRFEHFTLAGLVADGRNVYVHAKVALVDDCWATIGSANLMPRSFHADTELNASFWDAHGVAMLRRELLSEHLGVDTTDDDARAALSRFRDVAHANRDRLARGEPLRGLAIALDPACYGDE